jgi:hypothetical protein
VTGFCAEPRQVAFVAAIPGSVAGWRLAGFGALALAPVQIVLVQGARQALALAGLALAGLALLLAAGDPGGSTAWPALAQGCQASVIAVRRLLALYRCLLVRAHFQPHPE